MDLISIIIICIICFIGVLFIALGIYCKYRANYLIKKCTNKCEGILKEIRETEVDIGSDGVFHIIKSYIPIYEYGVQGILYKLKGARGDSFRKGEIVEINYNPEKPEECYIEGTNFILSWILPVIFGIIFLIVALGFIFLIKLIF